VRVNPDNALNVFHVPGYEFIRGLFQGGSETPRALCALQRIPPHHWCPVEIGVVAHQVEAAALLHRGEM